MKRLLQRFLTLPKAVVVVSAVGLLLLIGFLDFVTGRDLSVSAFYLAPICWAASRAGRRAGYVLAVVGAGVWLVADLASGYSYPHPIIGYWNGAMLLVLFLVVAHGLANLQAAQTDVEKSLLERTNALRMLEAEVDARLQAERLAAIGKMSAQIAHEVRNPLTAISVRLHSLKKNLRPESSEDEDAQVIGHEIERLERLVREFLQFAKPSEPKLLTVSADSLLTKVQSLLGPKLEKNAIQLDLQSAPDLWLQADPHQIQQVLINLVLNAAESIEADGAITLRAAAKGSESANGHKPVVILEVSDSGKGIEPEVQKRMFDPFFSTKVDGTGLGLAIAIRIIEKHGGTIECRSGLKDGATFRILLPQGCQDAPNDHSTENSID